MSARRLRILAVLLAILGAVLLTPSREPEQGRASHEPAPVAGSIAPTGVHAPAPTPPPTHGDRAPASTLPPVESGPTSFDTPPPDSTPPHWDPAGVTAAGEAAVALITAYAGGVADQETWWAGMRQYLTEPARKVYVTVDATRVVQVMITDPPTVDTSLSPYLAQVQVPTDSGQYAVQLVRTEADALWLAERIILPTDRR